MTVSATPSLTQDDFLQFIGIDSFTRVSKNSEHSCEIIYDSKLNRTHYYDPRILVLRRGSSFKLVYTSNSRSHLHAPSLILLTKSQNSGVKLIINADKSTRRGFVFTRASTVDNVTTVNVDILSSAPVGLYKVCLNDGNNQLTNPIPIFVVMNPFNKDDEVYCENPQMIHQYLLESKIHVYCGSECSYSSFKYKISQFSIECIAVSCYFLNQMNLKDRSKGYLVLRDLSARVNGNDDNGLMYGNWGEITVGVKPSSWTDAKDIYTQYIKTKSPVKWGQCFVFSMLLTSLARCYGVLTRSVTGFSIGHDEDGDGIITLNINAKTMENLNDSETRWNFHAWNNIFLKRTDYNIYETSRNTKLSHWQHLDGTPQEKSDGIYQCGPFPINFIRDNLIEAIPYDGPSIFSSINGITRYILKDDDGQVIKVREKCDCGNLILSTSPTNQQENITSSYKHVKSKDDKPRDTNKMKIEFVAPEKTIFDQTMNYTVKIEGASMNFDTIVKVAVILVDRFGHKIYQTPVYAKTHVFKTDSISILDSTSDVELPEKDLTLAYFKWEVRCYDRNKDSFKVKFHQTLILPSVEADIVCPDYFTSKTPEIQIKLTNRLKLPVSNVRLKIECDDKIMELENVLAFRENEEKTIPVSLKFRKLGRYSIRVFISTPHFTGWLAKKKISIV